MLALKEAKFSGPRSKAMPQRKKDLLAQEEEANIVQRRIDAAKAKIQWLEDKKKQLLDAKTKAKGVEAGAAHVITPGKDGGSAIPVDDDEDAATSSDEDDEEEDDEEEDDEEEDDEDEDDDDFEGEDPPTPPTDKDAVSPMPPKKVGCRAKTFKRSKSPRTGKKRKSDDMKLPVTPRELAMERGGEWSPTRTYQP